MKHLDLFDGYSISEYGEVRNRHGRALTPQTSWNGYSRIELSRRGKAKKHLVHRLVASTFVQNPDNKPCVNHIDGVKLNNHFSNLEWVTRSENQLHAYRLGLQVGYRKSIPMSPEHKAALCGSRWMGETRIYHAGGMTFAKPEDAAGHFGVKRGTFYSRVKSKNFTDWCIEIRREEKQCQRAV